MVQRKIIDIFKGNFSKSLSRAKYVSWNFPSSFIWTFLIKFFSFTIHLTYMHNFSMAGKTALLIFIDIVLFHGINGGLFRFVLLGFPYQLLKQTKDFFSGTYVKKKPCTWFFFLISCCVLHNLCAYWFFLFFPVNYLM